jgi:hypothetical protein
MNHYHVFFDGTSKKLNKKYSDTKISPSPLVPFEHLKKSLLNKTIKMANELVFLIFKQKIKSEDQHIIGLLKYFQIAVPKSNGLALDTAELKKPEFT